MLVQTEEKTQTINEFQMSWVQEKKKNEKNAVAMNFIGIFNEFAPLNDNGAHSMNKFRNNENKWHTQCKFKCILKHFPHAT